MDTEKIIADIEWLEQLFRLPDNRPTVVLSQKLPRQPGGQGFPVECSMPLSDYSEE